MNNTDHDSKVIAQAVLYASELVETDDRDKQKTVVDSILAHGDDQLTKTTMIALCLLIHDTRRTLHK